MVMILNNWSNFVWKAGKAEDNRLMYCSSSAKTLTSYAYNVIIMQMVKEDDHENNT